MVDKYSVTQYPVNVILGFIEAGDIAIPEIQRPFVWKASQVRDLIDSLYCGYPTALQELAGKQHFHICPDFKKASPGENSVHGEK